ncbi:MAG: very short patch repair endonuclease [Candidatus Omnitrophica bacterium]|nr:very short patch repair endonuclease [Candidatus Omnitrophota bacterium]
MSTGNKKTTRKKIPIKLGPPPKATSPQVSKSMKSNKAKNTIPEILLRKALISKGFIGYRLNFGSVPGTPDICYPKYKIAIFVHGCFWHRCPYCRLKLPKSHKKFWNSKFIRNKKRDALKKKALKNLGWKVLTIWECQIKKRLDKTVLKISTALKNRRASY